MRVSTCSIRQIRKFFELCVQAQDLPRHLGQHSGGMVVCQGQLDSVVPLEPATMPGRVVVQWDKEDCADMGIVKVDLLGLGMMAVLEESLQIIRENHGEEVDLGRSARERSDSLRDAAKSGHGGNVSDREPRADGVFAAAAAQMFLRHCRAGGHHSAGTDRRENGASLFEAAARPRSPWNACILRSNQFWRARWECRSFRSNCCAWP